MESNKNSCAFNFWTKKILKKFILINQESRQESNNSAAKYFYKLMNNSDFGYDCRNNLDNCKFVPMFDEYEEINFVSRYHSLFDSKVRQFITSNLLKKDIEEKLMISYLN